MFLPQIGCPRHQGSSSSDGVGLFKKLPLCARASVITQWSAQSEISCKIKLFMSFYDGRRPAAKLKTGLCHKLSTLCVCV